MPTTTTPPVHKPPHAKRKHDTRSLARRLKAASLDENFADDMDEFRNQLARYIAMYINNWHGCPELICTRSRGCMAPHGICTNTELHADDGKAPSWPEVQVEIYTALKEWRAELGLEGE